MADSKLDLDDNASDSTRYGSSIGDDEIMDPTDLEPFEAEDLPNLTILINSTCQTCLHRALAVF